MPVKVEIAPEQFEIPKGVFVETVSSVQHYTESLFQFRITRPASFRFRSGEFVMIGLPNAQKPVFRAYSIASPSWDEEIEFYSIKVPDGPLTQHLQKVRVPVNIPTPLRKQNAMNAMRGASTLCSIQRNVETAPRATTSLAKGKRFALRAQLESMLQTPNKRHASHAK